MIVLNLPTEQTHYFFKSNAGLSIIQLHFRSVNTKNDKLDNLVGGLIKSDTSFSPFSITRYTSFN